MLQRTSDTCDFYEYVPISIHDVRDPAYPAFLVAVDYISSKLHKIIRAEGLAYSAWLYPNIANVSDTWNF